VEVADASATALQQVPRGLLRVSAPVTFGANALVGAIGDYLHEYPEVHIELSLNDRVVNLIDEAFDVAIRIGNLPDSSLIRLSLTPTHDRPPVHQSHRNHLRSPTVEPVQAPLVTGSASVGHSESDRKRSSRPPRTNAAIPVRASGPPFRLLVG
jgi:DNA-binding transcriptional LysR family regulator